MDNKILERGVIILLCAGVRLKTKLLHIKHELLRWIINNAYLRGKNVPLIFRSCKDNIFIFFLEILKWNKVNMKTMFCKGQTSNSNEANQEISGCANNVFWLRIQNQIDQFFFCCKKVPNLACNIGMISNANFLNTLSLLLIA